MDYHISHQIDKSAFEHYRDMDFFNAHIRQKFINDLTEAIWTALDSGEKIVSLGKIYQGEIPALWAVELRQDLRIEDLVRCKDCKHRIVEELHGGELIRCDKDTWNALDRSRKAYDDEWFCADGERK